MATKGTNKRKTPNTQRIKAEDFLQKSMELHQQGYSMLMPGDMNFRPEHMAARTWDDFIASQIRIGSGGGGAQNTANGMRIRKRGSIPTLYFSSGSEQHWGTDNNGTPGLGWIEWGYGNVLPNVVALLTHLLPYTAAGVKFNSDLCAGLGPQPMYDCTQYVGGAITQKYIRYKDAGQWLRGRILDAQRELLNLYRIRGEVFGTQQDGNTSDDGDGQNIVDDLAQTALNDDPYEQKITSLYDDMIAQYEALIKKLKAGLERWEQTAPEVQKFLDRNNIPQTWLSMVLDTELFGMSFPEILLNQLATDKDGNVVKETKRWQPKVVGIRHRSCHTTRLERMDDLGNVNYVYCSNRWLDHPFIDQSAVPDDDIHAIRALNTDNPLQTLESDVRDAREHNVSVAERPTHFVLPCKYPSAGRPYYPTPAWYSIFGGDIYEYLSTIISDRLTRKRNSNIIGRIIYINNEYMQQVFIANKAQNNPKKQAELRDKIYTQINEWLANRDNAGQSLLAFTFVGNDNKEHHSFEILEVANNNSSAAAANEKETAEISSVVFMAMGLDARLMGSTPMSLVGGNSGTDIRERFLLRLILKSPQINIMLKPLEVISRFNGWDENLVWQVQREVMTTLDRSKTGIIAQSADSTQANAGNSKQ